MEVIIRWLVDGRSGQSDWTSFELGRCPVVVVVVEESVLAWVRMIQKYIGVIHWIWCPYARCVPKKNDGYETKSFCVNKITCSSLPCIFCSCKQGFLWPDITESAPIHRIVIGIR
jgi:hypothetical protein